MVKKSVSGKPDKKKTDNSKRPAQPDPPVPVVGVGASAGGLKALEGLFGTIPAESRVSFVVIQHMDPVHKSMLVELLSRISKLPVSEITDGIKIEAGRVYVTPPNSLVTIMERKLFLIKPEISGSARLPIDYFFTRLAEDLREHSIGVVLSGTGSDGTAGIKAIKAVGGLSIAQSEEQAEHSGMPASAIASGYVDLVAEVQKMSERIFEFLRHPYVAREKEPLGTGEANLNVPKILNLVRTRTGNDFSKYKQNTIRRRIERRMAVHRIERATDYFRFLAESSAELDALFKDLLIGVTNFFRDPQAFELLAEKVIAQIVKNKPNDVPIRVWVPGCSTGEEAYSIAILLTEAMESQGKHLNTQIFGTDIDPDAIQSAREGIFPENIASDIPENRLARFFVRDGKTFRISKPIREMVVFAVQNVIKDPPFSRIDLLSCRNLLIYLEPELQKKLLPLFHYTLNPDGFLFLGPSESANAFTDLFATFDQKWKVFSCKPSMARLETLPPFDGSFPVRAGSAASKSHPTPDIRSIAQRILLDDYAPPSVIVNEKFEIVLYQGQTQKYLRMPVGEPNHNLLKLVRRELSHKLGVALNTAQRQKTTVATPGIRFKEGDQSRCVGLIVRPLTETEMPKGSMIVVFIEESSELENVVAKPTGQSDASELDAGHRQLERELAYTRETLQTTIEELETSNEELKSTNEELQSTNEELQSTNEELETSKEEMHSTNEELVTVNSELQRKVNELEHVNNDISNLLAATDIGTLFLDGELRIKRFTPAVKTVFNLIDADVGRHIQDITSRLNYRALDTDAREVLRKLIPKEIEIETSNGQRVTMRILPYRTVDNVIDGVVVTFIHAGEELLELIGADRAKHICEILNEMVPEPVLLVDKDLKILDANARFLHMLGMDKSSALGKSFVEMVDATWGTKAVRLLENNLKSGRDVRNFVLNPPTGAESSKALTINSFKIDGAIGQPPIFLIAVGTNTRETA